MGKDTSLMTTSTGLRGARRRLLLPPAALAAALSVIMPGAAVPALAQTEAPRGALSINGGLQMGASDFADSVSFDSALFGPEQGSFDTQYPGADDALFDVGGSVRVWRNLAVGATVSWLTRETDAGVTAQLPHPFWFDRPRSISGTATGLARTETAVHVQAQWVIPVSRSVAVTLFGGPTWFSATQDLVANVTYEQSYPFDEASFMGARADEQSKSAIGAHAGADVAYYFSERIGVGGMFRFSRGSVEFDTADGDTLENDVGGAHVAGGLRIRF